MTACPSPFNLADYVLTAGRATPDKIALSILGPSRAERWSYAALERAVRAVGAGLLETGLVPGDQVLLRLGNGVAFPLAYLGAISVGIVPVPTAAQLTTHEVDSCLHALDPKAIIRGDGIAGSSAALPTITEAELLQMARQDAQAAYQLGDPERIAYILFTSGTSGAPRAVAHAHRAIWARRMMFDGWYGLRPDDRLLHAGALNWSFTLGTGLLDPWTVGATALVPQNGTALEALPLLLGRHDATLFAAVPGVLRKLLKTPERLQLPKLRHTLTAGEHLLPALRTAWETTTAGGLYDAYGMTECSTFLSASPHGAPSLTPQADRKVTVLDDGTIAIHKDETGLMLGYMENGVPVLPLDGDYFKTGDVADQDERGTITYRGRSDDLMTTGGYRISPLEIEAVLAQVPDIGEVAVASVAVKDTTIIAAFHTGAPETDIKAHLSKHLAPYKHPRAFQVVDALPRSANGKLLRAFLPSLFRSDP